MACETITAHPPSHPRQVEAEMLCVLAVLMAVTRVSLLFPISLAIPKQGTAIPSSSLIQAKVPEAVLSRTGSRDSNCHANW